MILTPSLDKQKISGLLSMRHQGRGSGESKSFITDIFFKTKSYLIVSVNFHLKLHLNFYFLRLNKYCTNFALSPNLEFTLIITKGLNLGNCRTFLSFAQLGPRFLYFLRFHPSKICYKISSNLC